ncbi:predicted protein [Sclerotinia sclerotiorum 1980 UF-70]|uniref:Uncharacterized protein n=1 Tax=Sclerotinia sclerotiorum (strain ATCC 18683 / 1980 / Ss-1) TaxID=665079 RepID=A7EPS7_SCLS1|nr:predicted protein [Sclerotinia sclerotiorum 1980 UF-70]EDO04843.1 predicted protein [Sclerotinia sclerotiorum 1980 UF-70]
MGENDTINKITGDIQLLALDFDTRQDGCPANNKEEESTDPEAGDGLESSSGSSTLRR